MCIRDSYTAQAPDLPLKRGEGGVLLGLERKELEEQLAADAAARASKASKKPGKASEKPSKASEKNGKASKPEESEDVDLS